MKKEWRLIAGVETSGLAGTAPEILGLPLLDPGVARAGAVLLIPEAPVVVAVVIR